MYFKPTFKNVSKDPFSMYSVTIITGLPEKKQWYELQLFDFPYLSRKSLLEGFIFVQTAYILLKSVLF